MLAALCMAILGTAIQTRRGRLCGLLTGTIRCGSARATVRFLTAKPRMRIAG